MQDYIGANDTQNGVYPISSPNIGFSDGSACKFYYFDPAKASNLTLDAPFTGELTLLFSTFNGVVGLPAEFADAVLVNAPIGAKDDSSLYEGTGQQVTRTVTGLTEVIGATFDGVLWGYALDGVWYFINRGAISQYSLFDWDSQFNNFEWV